MIDSVLASFLEEQYRRWEEFAPLTDRVHVHAVGATPAQRYVAEFDCKGLVRRNDGEVVEASKFVVAISFAEDHLRKPVEPIGLAWMLHPSDVFHPNIAPPGIICLGHLTGATGLLDVIYQIHSILTYQNASLEDCLNREAADWARTHQDRLPVDRRPLKRRDFAAFIREAVE
jgi:ubiquitin-protein ligase